MGRAVGRNYALSLGFGHAGVAFDRVQGHAKTAGAVEQTDPYFCHPGPIMLLREPERPFLVYSAGDGPDSLAAEARNRRLTSLLGRTRAEVLRLLGAERPLTTTELARAAGISLAGASQHASILREAGLVLTERHGGSVPHRASGRGAALL